MSSNDETLIGVREILDNFDDDSLFSLSATVTQGLLRNRVESREEAISAIINYSTNVTSILNRKIVTKEVLFGYLHKKNLTVQLPATKLTLIENITAYWKSRQQPQPQGLNTQDYAVSALAEQFSEWFYSIMNSNESIGAEHFYPDAKSKINLEVCGESLTEIVEDNPEQIAQQLFLTKMKYNLYFNPNLTSEGVQGRMDPHGLVLVLACGTLHSNNACVGVFEQVFALARDPFAENNWKVKSSELNLKSKTGIFNPPSLCDNELTGNLLSLPSS